MLKLNKNNEPKFFEAKFKILPYGIVYDLCRVINPNCSILEENDVVIVKIFSFLKHKHNEKDMGYLLTIDESLLQYDKKHPDLKIKKKLYEMYSIENYLKYGNKANYIYMLYSISFSLISPKLNSNLTIETFANICSYWYDIINNVYNRFCKKIKK